MPQNIAEHGNSIQRRVENTEWEGKTARVVILQKVYGAETSDLWEAITQPDRLKRWFASISGDLREGGNYQLEGNAGGTIRRCIENELIEVTWEYGGEIG